MTFSDLLKIYNQGIYPIIVFTKFIDIYDNQFEENMVAKIKRIDFEEKGKLFKSYDFRIMFDESNFKCYNACMESKKYTTNTGIKLKYSDKTKRLNLQNINMSPNHDLNEEIPFFNFYDNNTNKLVKEYLSSKSELSYEDWLQEQILTLRMIK